MAAIDTIYAVSSGHGRAGIAVVRISGSRAGEIAKALCGQALTPRLALRVTVRDPATGDTLDRCLAQSFATPASFTGEDVLELHLHGGPAVVAGVLDAIARCPGTRTADPGEFTRRAFLNGKLDLTEAEGLADLIAAETAAQRRLALRQSGGELRRLYDGWREQLLDALALVEAGLDFMDEADVPVEAASRASPIVDDLILHLRRHLDDGKRGEILRDGFRVVLAGPPNVGKSSLLNALARRPAAIVSEEPGTTRDIIEVWIELDGLPLVICDTAGLRQATSKVEREGIRRTIERASDADLVIWLMDELEPDTRLPPELEARRDRVLWVLNKIDQRQQAPSKNVPPDTLSVSTLTGEGLDALILRLCEVARGDLAAGEAPVLTRRRHRDQLEAALQGLQAFRSGDAKELELRAEDLRSAATALGRITGRVDVEDVLDRIFSAFCIGK